VNVNDLDSMYLKFGITEEVRARLMALTKLGTSVLAESPKLVVETVIIADGKRTIVSTEGPRA